MAKEGLPEALEWSPLQFMERFAAIIPPPRKHLTRYYGALGPQARADGGDEGAGEFGRARGRVRRRRAAGGREGGVARGA